MSTLKHTAPNQITIERITRADGSQFSAARVSRDREHLASYPAWLNAHDMPTVTQVQTDARWNVAANIRAALVARLDKIGSTYTNTRNMQRSNARAAAARGLVAMQYPQAMARAIVAAWSAEHDAAADLAERAAFRAAAEAAAVRADDFEVTYSTLTTANHKPGMDPTTVATITDAQGNTYTGSHWPRTADAQVYALRAALAKVPGIGYDHAYSAQQYVRPAKPAPLASYTDAAAHVTAEVIEQAGRYLVRLVDDDTATTVGVKSYPDQAAADAYARRCATC